MTKAVLESMRAVGKEAGLKSFEQVRAEVNEMGPRSGSDWCLTLCSIR